MGKRKTAVLIRLLILSFLCCSLSGGANADPVVNWPKNAKIVGEEMFFGNMGIDAVVLPEGVEKIGPKAFANSSLREITLPDTISEIAEDAFSPGIHLYVHATEGGFAYTEMRNRGYQVEYRALLIGEVSFLRDGAIQKATRNWGDVRLMADMLQNKVSGITGAPFDVVSEKNLSYDGIHDAIKNTFEGKTMEQDVSLIFIASHGNRNNGSLEMPYLGDPENDEAVSGFCSSGKDALPLETLASWLNMYVKGKVIVILESCYAGYAVYSPDPAENSSKGNSTHGLKKESPEGTVDFAEKAVQVFAEMDPGVVVTQKQDGSPADGRKGAGAFARENKFYVLAASGYDEESYGKEDERGSKYSYNYFTKWLVGGAGSAKYSPADIFPKDGILTFQELFEYIKSQSNTIGFMVNGKVTYQHVQGYPLGSGFECFALK